MQVVPSDVAYTFIKLTVRFLNTVIADHNELNEATDWQTNKQINQVNNHFTLTLYIDVNLINVNSNISIHY